MSADALSLCAQCAVHSTTCCENREVLVTMGDIARIAEHTGLDGFWELAAPGDASYLDQDDDPNWLRWVFRPDGTRPILKQSGEACLFMTQTGCALPVEVRPLVCRLSPCTYTEQGIDGVTGECPATLITDGRDLLEAVGMSVDDAARWHHMLYAELRTKERYHADRPDL